MNQKSKSPQSSQKSKSQSSSSSQAQEPSSKKAHRKGGKKGKRRAALGQEEPHRACIVCRTSAPSRTMLRFARATDGAVGFDVGAVLPGRGAWVCATRACLDKALEQKHGGFARAFDAAVVFDGAELKAAVVGALLGDVLARLGLLRRQGALVVGREEVFRRVGDLAAVAVAVDLSANSRREVEEALSSTSLSSTPSPQLPPMERLGDALGIRAVGVVGLPKSPATAALQESLARYWGVVPSPPSPPSTPSTP